MKGDGRRFTVSIPTRLSWVLLALCMLPLMAQAQVDPNPPPRPFSYDFPTENELSARIDPDDPDPGLLREIFGRRRARVMEAMPGGAMLVFSVEWVQPRRLEFQVPDSDNHDFIYLTGV
jgi:hypothetical protein